MQVHIIRKAESHYSGVRRYTDELITALALEEIATSTSHPNTPALARWGNRFSKPLNIDLEAFLNGYPLTHAQPIAPDADIVQIPMQTMATLLQFKRFQQPVMVTILDIIPLIVEDDPALNIFRHGVDRAFYHRAMALLDRADRLTSISAYTKQAAVEHLGLSPDKIDVVYCALDLDHFRPLASIPPDFFTRYPVDRDRPTILFVGSEDPRKNFITLVHAFQRVRQHLPDAQLLKVGRPNFGAERERILRAIAEHDLDAAVHFYEDVSDTDLLYFYNCAHVSVQPSLYEGFGYPVVEAMACGTPALVANTTSLPELVGDLDVRFDPLDVDGLAERLIAVLESTTLREELRQGALQQAQRFSRATIGQAARASYQRLLS